MLGNTSILLLVEEGETPKVVVVGINSIDIENTCSLIVI